LRLPLKGLDSHACQKTQQYNDSLVMVNNMSAILQSRLAKHLIYRCKHGEKYPPASITAPSPKLRPDFLTEDERLAQFERSAKFRPSEVKPGLDYEQELRDGFAFKYGAI